MFQFCGKFIRGYLHPAPRIGVDLNQQHRNIDHGWLNKAKIREEITTEEVAD